MGYRVVVSDEPPAGQPVGGGTAFSGEPHPVDVFGEAKPILDSKIGKYMTRDVMYYIDVYENNKLFGFPYKDWTRMPQWIRQLHKMFSRTEAEYENWRHSQQANG